MSERSVYVIRSEPGPVKIGTASNARRRFSHLRTASPLRLSLEFVGNCEQAQAKQIEARAHAKLKEKHERGEWFSTSVEEAVRVVLESAAELGFSIVATNDPQPQERRVFRAERVPKLCSRARSPEERRSNIVGFRPAADLRRRILEYAAEHAITKSAALRDLLMQGLEIARQ